MSSPKSSVPLGTYLLPGRVVDPTDGPVHAQQAEELGLHTVWISERWDQKEAAVLLGAISNATSRVKLATGIIHPHTRHPLVLASMALTLQWLSGGRFVLGLGRGIPGAWPMIGLPQPTTQALSDVAGLLRRLWAREEVSYEGPLGRFPALKVDHRYEGSPPPLLLAAIGPRTLELAGQAFDGAILHPLLTADAAGACAARVRAAAEQAGRDPATIRVYAGVVVAPGLTPEREAAVVGGRAVTYLQIPHYGELIARTNGWDQAGLERIRGHAAFAALGGDGLAAMADQRFTLEQLAEVGRAVPAEWIRAGAAVGTPAQVAARLREYLEAGVDEVIMHASPPSTLGPVLQAMFPEGTRT
jgi:5,10-methylenetetrahydromethanopterin reductase